MSTNNRDRSTIFQLGIVILVIVGIAYSGYNAQLQTEIALRVEKQQQNFQNMWEERIKFSNVNNNNTQARLLNIANNQSQVESELLNASKHRTIITQEVLELQNITNTLIQQFNATNEEKRVEAVNNLTEAIEQGIGISSENQEYLKKLLEANNITIPVENSNSTENISERDIIALFKELQNK